MNERFIDRIKKLIRHERHVRRNVGAGGCTPEEAAKFAAKIQQLCIDHKIEAEQISVDEEKPGKGIGHEDFTTTGRKERYGYRVSVRGEDGRLMHIVAHAHFCEAIVITHSNCITLVGEEQDRAVCIEMFKHLRRTMLAGSRRGEAEQRRARRTARKFHYWYCLGFVQTIERRYRDLREAAENKTTALVKADALVKQYAHEMFEIKTTSFKAKGRRNLHAKLLGMIDADNVSLAANVVAGREQVAVSGGQ